MEASFLREGNPLLAIYWMGLSVILLMADYFAGPFIQFPITYLVPIYLASWFNGRRWGLAFALILPLIRLFFNIAFWTVPWSWVEASANCLIRMIVFSLFVTLIDRTARQNRELSREVNLLTGLLPICAYCKKIRDDNDQWQPVEAYIARTTAAAFTHGVCPECMEKELGQFLGTS